MLTYKKLESFYRSKISQQIDYSNNLRTVVLVFQDSVTIEKVFHIDDSQHDVCTQLVQALNRRLVYYNNQPSDDIFGMFGMTLSQIVVGDTIIISVDYPYYLGRISRIATEHTKSGHTYQLLDVYRQLISDLEDW